MNFIYSQSEWYFSLTEIAKNFTRRITIRWKGVEKNIEKREFYTLPGGYSAGTWTEYWFVRRWWEIVGCTVEEINSDKTHRIICQTRRCPVLSRLASGSRATCFETCFQCISLLDMLKHVHILACINHNFVFLVWKLVTASDNEGTGYCCPETCDSDIIG